MFENPYELKYFYRNIFTTKINSRRGRKPE